MAVDADEALWRGPAPERPLLSTLVPPLGQVDDSLVGQVNLLSAHLDLRSQQTAFLAQYDEGGCPIPDAIVQARVTRAYRALMPLSEAPWGSLVVDSVQDRLEISGIQDEDKDAAAAVWGLWQDMGMDAESKLAHRSTLLDGRAYATVWPDPDTGKVSISLDGADQMIVQYREGSRRTRVAALRRWVEGRNVYATLYRPDGIYKFVKSNVIVPGEVTTGSGSQWRQRTVRGERWPLPNPLKIVPVVELAVNRRLKPGSFGYARGEYEHCTGLIDRINLLTFFGLVVAFWMGFPLRGVIGQRVMRDDDNKVIPPFSATADSVFMLPDADAKLAEFSAADRKNLSVFAELDQLAVISKTPRHYFPLEQGMSNISADAIRASEGALHAKVTGHKASLGEGWEEVLRLGGLMLDTPVKLSPRAELLWKDHESRSLAERADAAVKLKDILPPTAIIERVLNATADEAARYQSEAASNALLSALTAPPPVASNVPTEPQGGANGL